MSIYLQYLFSHCSIDHVINLQKDGLTSSFATQNVHL